MSDQILAQTRGATEVCLLGSGEEFWKQLLNEPWLELKADLVQWPEACFTLGKLALPGRCSSHEEISWLQKRCLAVSPRLVFQQKWWRRRCQQHPGTVARCRALHRHSSEAPKLLCPMGIIRASSLGPKLWATDFTQITSIWSSSTDFSEIPAACNSAAKSRLWLRLSHFRAYEKREKCTNFFSHTGGGK